MFRDDINYVYYYHMVAERDNGEIHQYKWIEP